METVSCFTYSIELGTALQEKAKSCFRSTSFEASGEEMATVVMLPSFSDITGPCFLDSLASDWWGLGPRCRMLPMIGIRNGPGGSLDGFRALEFDVRMIEHIQVMDKATSRNVRKSMELRIFVYVIVFLS